MMPCRAFFRRRDASHSALNIGHLRIIIVEDLLCRDWYRTLVLSYSSTWIRRILDTGPRLEQAVIIVNASSVMDDEGVRTAWMFLLRPNAVPIWPEIQGTRASLSSRTRLAVIGTGPLFLLYSSTRATMDNPRKDRRTRKAKKSCGMPLVPFNGSILNIIV
ncbi:hypothetical protein EDD18DRAFT_697686 [Armillaria luteobubalina]|uniref:Uncharacterized protein n=1 Tax=Armillaria luteobubalina TaxID=153913 RepID=A0AA39TFB7_9AGAR|nr:hypothetical protein EDD18DRAFT_697686 [Armillaria luteobubalina]